MTTLAKHLALGLVASLTIAACGLGSNRVNLEDEMQALASSPLFASAPSSVSTIDRVFEPECLGSFPPEYTSTLTFEGMDALVVEKALVDFYEPIIFGLGWRPDRTGGFDDALFNVNGEFEDLRVSAVLFPVDSDDEMMIYTYALSVLFDGADCPRGDRSLSEPLHIS